MRKKVYETEEEARVQQRAVERLMDEWKENLKDSMKVSATIPFRKREVPDSNIGQETGPQFFRGFPMFFR
jgi:hypothetical protein